MAAPSPGTPIGIELDFCANDTPIWFAFQDGTDPYQVVTPSPSGTFNFTASSRLVVAYVRQRGNGFRTDILFTTNGELAPMSDVTCLEQGGAQSVSGTVAGHSGTQVGHVSLSSSSVFVGAGQSTWTLSQLVARPLDLVASRVDITGTDRHSNRTIIRRAQNPATASALPVLDFAGEGFSPAPHTVNVGGALPDETAVVDNTFFSQLGTLHTLTFLDNVIDGPVVVEAVPVTERTTPEYHRLSVISRSSTGGTRTVERYFGTPDFQNITFGPPLTDPSVTLAATTPSVRLRTVLLGQIDYSTVVNMAYSQQSSTQSIDVSMLVTASYIGGTPETWNLPMPELSALAGWRDEWELKPGSIAWRVSAYFGRPQLIFGGPPIAAGETVLSASRSSSLTVNP